jgi:hypothetical protein
MNPVQRYTFEISERYREVHFKDHRATIIAPLEDSPVAVINWQKPGTWNYGCRFIIHRRWLVVVGDIGEAVFEWGQDITPEFLLKINLDYFLGKCQASHNGRKFEGWNNQVALENSVRFFSDGMESLRNELCAEFTLGTSKDEYEAVARVYYDSTGNAECASAISSFGIVPDSCAIGMFVGLQMALALLKGEKP